MFGRFLTAEGGLGHMIIKHDNLDQTWEFYSLLGMRGGIEYQIPLPGGEAIELMFGIAVSVITPWRLAWHQKDASITLCLRSITLMT